METTFFEISKKAVFSQFLKKPLNGIDLSLALVLGVNNVVIKRNNNEDIEFLGQDLVNIVLKAGRYVEQPKRHYLVLEVAVLSPESRFLFIALFHPHPMVSTREVKLAELFCSA